MPATANSNLLPQAASGPRDIVPLTPRLTRVELSELSGCTLSELTEPICDADNLLVALQQGRDEHVLLDHILAGPEADAIERLVRAESTWSLNEKYFLSKHDVVWAQHELGHRQSFRELDELEKLLGIGKTLIETTYNAVVGARYEIKATKMVAGQRVDIHNDSPDGSRGRTETHRLLYYPNREYTDSQGGHLLFYADSAACTILDGVRPIFNSGVLIRLSDHSYHSVSRVLKGVRYTIAFLYWGYPILFEETTKRETVANCLKTMIDAGFEEVPYRGTTLAYHLYHTYRLLAEWGAPFSVCLAGLMRAVPEASAKRERSLELNRAAIGGLVNDHAVRVMGRLSSGKPSAIGGLERDAKIVELASILEQAEDSESIMRGCEFMATIDGLDDPMKKKIEEEISRLRAEVASVGNSL